VKRLSATDCFRPALDRTRALLFQPFRFAFWCRLALLGFLTGELTSSGCNFNYGGNFPTDTGRTDRTQSFFAMDPVWERVAHYWWLIAIGAVVLFVFFLVFMYLASVARFMLFEAVLEGSISLRTAWRRWRPLSHTYFLFQLAFFVCLWVALLVVIGLPVFLAWRAGFFQNFTAHLLIGVLGITALVGIAALILVTAALIHVFAKDFVVPIMALEDLPFGSAWRGFVSLLSREKGGFAAYIGIKIVLAIAAAIVFGMGAILFLLVLLIPIAIVAAIVIGIGAAAGLTWTPATIALAVALGVNALIAIMIIITFCHTPLAAFFPSYSLYFLAGRYAPLHDRLYPEPPPPVPTPPPDLGPDLPPETGLG
jgi:hypothetical protein